MRLPRGEDPLLRVVQEGSQKLGFLGHAREITQLDLQQALLQSKRRRAPGTGRMRRRGKREVDAFVALLLLFS